MTAAADFRADYSPGGMSERAARRARARHAGRRSGIVRRRWARQRRGYAPDQLSAPLEWKIRHVDREEFDRRYERVSTRPERPSAAIQWEHRRDALWEHCASSEALVRARGQHIGTTRRRRAVGLAQRGVGGRSQGGVKCDRTIYTYNQLLAAMGIAGFQHVRAPRGQKDYLRVEWRMSRRLPISLCRQPCGTGNTTSFAGVPRRSTSKTSSIAPPSAADPDPPDKPAEQPAADDEDPETAWARWHASCEARRQAAAGGVAEMGSRRRVEAAQQLVLELLEQQDARQVSGQDRERIASTTSEGFRCST